MEKWIRGLFLLFVALVVSGCGHLAYMGMHGNSIKMYPDIHEAVQDDAQCLECHHPDDPQGPPSPHPDFTGCINCHND